MSFGLPPIGQANASPSSRAAGETIEQLEQLVSRIELRLGLSHAMAEVAVGVWLDLSEKAMAVWLGKSPSTIHEHIRRIYRDPRWPRLHSRVTVALAVERVANGCPVAAHPGAPHSGDTCFGDETPV